jgi:hypothetical protein
LVLLQNFGGGGGAGGLLNAFIAITSGSYPIVVGSGGRGDTNQCSNIWMGCNGGDSSFDTFVAYGGGGGGGHDTHGSNGGSGGGTGSHVCKTGIYTKVFH